MKKIVFIFFFIILPQINLLSSLNPSFVENKGQILNTEGKIEENIKYYNNKISPSIYITNDYISFVLNKINSEFRLISYSEFGIDKKFEIEASEVLRIDLLFEKKNKFSNLEAQSAQNNTLNYYLPHLNDGIIGVKSYKIKS